MQYLWIASKLTDDLNVLQNAINQFLEVISAWNGEELVGLIRIVGDGLTIIYIQDILVLNAYQNQGIATRLIQKVLHKYKSIRQKVLLTEEAPDVRHFYEKNGFESCDQGSLVAFAKLGEIRWLYYSNAKEYIFARRYLNYRYDSKLIFLARVLCSLAKKSPVHLNWAIFCMHYLFSVTFLAVDRRHICVGYYS